MRKTRGGWRVTAATAPFPKSRASYFRFNETRRSGLYSNNNLELLKDYLFRKYGRLPFRKSFRKTWLDSKRNTTSWVVPGENFGGNRQSDKAVLFFRTECTKQSVLHFFGNAIFDNSFRLSWPFFGKSNCTNGRHDSGTRVLNFTVVPFAQTVNQPVCICKYKKTFFMYLLFKTFRHKIS